MNLIIDECPTAVSEHAACQSLNIARTAVRRLRQKRSFCGPMPARRLCRKTAPQPRALSQAEREHVLSVLNSETFCEQPPAQVYYSLLSQGVYMCSISTMHRLLRSQQQHGERRQQRPAQHNPVPRLRAKQPNEVWTWDISKLPTEKRGEYLSLYMVMDLYSRYIVAWMLSTKENSALSQQLIQEAATRYRIEPGQLTLHQDRGTPMTAHCYLDLLGELAITASHSRPRVSNDNPHSESLFKTAKYQPDYPRRFANYSHARQWCEEFVEWYNNAHHHSSLAGYTPSEVFTGENTVQHIKRMQAREAHFERHPNRYVNGRPTVAKPPSVVEINPVDESREEPVDTVSVNIPTLNRVKTNLSPA